MKTKTLGELKSEARDHFSYILVFCPNFPSYTGSTTKKTFEQMIGFLDAIIQQTKKEESKQWLRLCLQEVRSSWKNYDDGNVRKGKELIQQAREYYKNAFSKKPLEPRFIAGESGAIFDEKNGFPE